MAKAAIQSGIKGAPRKRSSGVPASGPSTSNKKRRVEPSDSSGGEEETLVEEVASQRKACSAAPKGEGVLVKSTSESVKNAARASPDVGAERGPGFRGG